MKKKKIMEKEIKAAKKLLIEAEGLLAFYEATKLRKLKLRKLKRKKRKSN